MRRIALLALVALLALPAVADAHFRHRAGKHAAVAACQSERQADVAAFKAKYANDRGRRAFRRCVRAHMRHARQTCRSERQADVAAFRTKYANQRGRRAFRRCVRQHAGDPVS